MGLLLAAIAPLFALVGGIVLVVALFTPKRFTAKRPLRFSIGFGLLGIAALFYYMAAQA